MTSNPGNSVRFENLQGKLRLSLIANGILLFLVLFLAVVLLLGERPPAVGDAAGGAPVQPPVAEEPGQPVRADEDDLMAVGDIDAPVVISEWADYRCPYCAVFANETLPILLKEYVDKGQVRIEFNDVYFFGEESLDAAVAARAAAQQGCYLPFVQELYSAAPEKGGHPPMPREKLLDFARAAGVADMAQFEKDLDSEEILASVQDGHDRAVAMGVSAVPFFVINGQPVSGAQPLDVFVDLIENAQP